MFESAPVEGERGPFTYNTQQLQHIADEILQDMENPSQVTSKSGPDRPCAKFLRLCIGDKRKRQVTVLVNGYPVQHSITTLCVLGHNLHNQIKQQAVARNKDA